jgi:hypothetical protein
MTQHKLKWYYNTKTNIRMNRVQIGGLTYSNLNSYSKINYKYKAIIKIITNIEIKLQLYFLAQEYLFKVFGTRNKR